MKKTILFLSMALVSVFMFAQTIVSTTPQNKNALIEEFTGVNCGYCPDGHKIAHDILVANPGRAYMIALHQGSYANATPDYRTSFGDAIAGQTGLTGYPAGTVNRHVFAGAGMTSGGTAMGRGSWSSSATTILGQSSPVNIAIDVDLNYDTRVMTVLCEVYYTANEATSTNKLNVAILQNYVKGPQAGSSLNPDFITPDGQYYHMHMLRHLITGQWGITIPTTTTGYFYDTLFTYTIPASYGAIPVELPQLEVVAFVSQGNQEVLTATGSPVNPPALDASITAISNITDMSCANTVAPKVTLKNNGASTLTSCDIKYSIDGGAEQTYAWTGSLATAATAEVTLPTQTITTNGTHSFTAHSTNPNASTDMNNVNDSYSKTFATFISTITSPVTEGFASTTFPPVNFAAIDVDADAMNWARSTAGHSAAGSAKIEFFNINSGKKDDMIIAPIDLTGKTNNAMTFYVAYRQYQSENDKIQVDVSTNCGSTWTTVWNKSGSTLSTGAATTNAFNAPTAAEWRMETVSLSAYDNTDDVMIRFRSTSGYGNNAYIDDINITQGAGIEDAIVSSFSVYPNPATDAVNVSFNSAHSSDALISIYNIDGSLVYQSSNFVTHGNNLISVPVSNLDNGFYTVRINVEGEMIQDRFVVVK